MPDQSERSQKKSTHILFEMHFGFNLFNSLANDWKENTNCEWIGLTLPFGSNSMENVICSVALSLSLAAHHPFPNAFLECSKIFIRVYRLAPASSLFAIAFGSSLVPTLGNAVFRMNLYRFTGAYGTGVHVMHSWKLHKSQTRECEKKSNTS